jgi:hypothetical protein
MTIGEKQELKLAYEAACTNYLAAFMEKYDLSCDPEPWVGNEVGTVAEVGDYFFDFQDIKRCVDEDVTFDTLIEWYDYNIEVSILRLPTINLKSWLMGAPRISEFRIADIKTKRCELENLIEETKREARK